MRSQDEKLMARAIELSRRGWPAPNPRVGCVLARGGRIVAEGWCERDGGDHAEVMALKTAGSEAAGCTAYVTLEPCSHYGRTPPCALALIQAGIAEAAAACLDPNPQAAGGLNILREAGIPSRSGLLSQEAAWVNRQFLWWARTGLPYVSLKAAVTVDGYIARLDGGERWITGEEARLEGRRLRVERGAVVVGRRTVQADQPALTSRIGEDVREPTKVVLDPGARLEGHEKALAPPRSLWLTGKAREGAVVLDLQEGAFAPSDILKAISSQGERGALVEGGAATFRSFLEADLAQEIHLFMAPKAWGEGLAWTGGWEGSLTDQGFELYSQKACGPDLWIVWSKRAAVLGTIAAEGGS